MGTEDITASHADMMEAAAIKEGASQKVAASAGVLVGAGAVAVAGLPGAALPLGLVAALGVAGAAFGKVSSHIDQRSEQLRVASADLDAVDQGRAAAITSGSATV
jgi:hypothetical protein